MQKSGKHYNNRYAWFMTFNEDGKVPGSSRTSEIA
jgi:ketosteroid isomerase-like protein